MDHRDMNNTGCTFYYEGNEVGKLLWADGKFKFEGDADASAKIFIDALNRGDFKGEGLQTQRSDKQPAAGDREPEGKGRGADDKI